MITWLASTWRTHRLRLLTLGAGLLGLLGVIANIVGILAWFGVSPPAGGKTVIETPSIGLTVSSETLPPTIVFPSLKEIYRDEFSSQTTGWDHYAKSNAATGYEDGRYYIDIRSSRMLFLSIWKGVGQIDNGILQVDVLGPFEDAGYAQGIGFGWHQDWVGSTYAFTIDSSGICRFWEATDGWLATVDSALPLFDNVQGYHTIQVHIRGNEATGYVDGMFCAKYVLPDYKRGYIGVVAAPSYDVGHGKYYFDEYRMFELP